MIIFCLYSFILFKQYLFYPFSQPLVIFIKSKPKAYTWREMFCCVGQKKERKIVNGKFRKPFYNFASVVSGKVLDVGQDSE